MLASTSEDCVGKRFYSQGILEPDKVASAWLIARHICPEARVEILSKESDRPSGGTAFDVAWADWEWLRTSTRSTYETILSESGLSDPGLMAIGEMIRVSEIMYWTLEPDTPAGRFDRDMKELALQDGLESMFDYLDKFYARKQGLLGEQ